MKTADCTRLARDLFDKHKSLHPSLAEYTGIVSLHGLARLAVLTGEKKVSEKILSELEPFLAGRRTWKANFSNYFCGGNATAFLLWKGLLPEAEKTVREHARQILHEAPRDPDGIVCRPGHPGAGQIWIDAAFAVGPFLLFAGLALEDERMIDDAFQQTAKMVEVFRNGESGLLHQCKNIKGPGLLSEDHWSRGNGWGAYALAELAVYLPQGHPHKQRAVALYLDHVEACARFQNNDGLWHQEMTEPRSYVETSGSGLLLYALGLGLEHGLVDAKEIERFRTGLAGLLPYITSEYDVHHTSCGCLCPGEGTKLDYMANAPVMNDRHAFGPLVLAYGQAAALGIHTVERTPTPC